MVIYSNSEDVHNFQPNNSAILEYTLQRNFVSAKGDISKNAYCSIVFNSKKEWKQLKYPAIEWINLEYIHITKINGQVLFR